ncbi:unnamed protein product [Onchocerca flexuosa]|uniref:Secreted protein n=1 Tax=Onchocerca flexuosa TaxID=387005 RepID=A0A183HRK6_9BILA|nr:unnamed protein product [Onchocerca flexuosa]
MNIRIVMLELMMQITDVPCYLGFISELIEGLLTIRRIGTMLPHIGLTAIERVIQRRCSLFLRHRFIPIATVTRRNVESVSNKEIKMNQNKSILEKVVMKESQTTVEKGISVRI